MKIYLAGQFKDQSLMREWSAIIQQNGFEITSRWLNCDEVDLNLNKGAIEAHMDLADIDASDIVLSRTLIRGETYTGGGRHIEFGYALAKGKKLINVGGNESVFHSYAMTFQTLQLAIDYMLKLK